MHQNHEKNRKGSGNQKSTQIYLKNMCLSYRLKPYYFDTTYRFLIDFSDSVFYYYHPAFMLISGQIKK